MDDQAPPPPPPPPPPHGENPKTTKSGLPDGNYDIFIIPPHSAGSGFLYLPSLQPQRNSFLAGVACTLLAIGIWTSVVPALKQWMITIAASGGAGVTLLVFGVGVAAWAFGKTQGESTSRPHTTSPPPPPPPPGSGPGFGASDHGSQSYGSHHAHASGDYEKPRSGPQPQWSPPRNEYARPPPHPNNAESHSGPMPTPPPQPAQGSHSAPPPQSPKPDAKATSAAWEKAREETRKREEARKRAEELRRMREEAAKKKEEAEKQARAAAEKIRWEQAKQREKEIREREAREKLAKEKADKEKAQRDKDKREQDIREKINRQKLEFEKAAKDKAAAEVTGRATSNYPASPEKSYERPTARSYASTETASHVRGRDRGPLASSTSSYTESSYAPTISTARTSPPPEYRRPYKTSDPDKVVIKGVYMYNSMSPKPVSQLVSGEGSVSDGLILRLTTEGLFVDDDVRHVPQREWDIKAWTIDTVESGEMKPFHVLKASIKDIEKKRYVFVLPSDEAWKMEAGIVRLKKGSLSRSMSTKSFKLPEMKKLMGDLGYIQ